MSRPPLSIQHNLAAIWDTFAEYEGRITRQDTQIAQQNERIAQLDELIARQDARIARQDELIARQNAQIIALRQDMNGLLGLIFLMWQRNHQLEHENDEHRRNFGNRVCSGCNRTHNDFNIPLLDPIYVLERYSKAYL